MSDAILVRELEAIARNSRGHLADAKESWARWQRNKLCEARGAELRAEREPDPTDRTILLGRAISLRARVKSDLKKFQRANPTPENAALR